MFKKISAILIAMFVLTAVFAGCNGDTNPETTTQSETEETEVANSLQRVIDSGEFTVVGSGGYRPFNYIDENGDVIGFDVDTGKEIAERLGVELNYVTSDWDGLVEGLKAGRYDGILGSMAITEDRLLEVDFSIPYYYSGAQLTVLKDSGLTDPSEMDGKTIAVATGTTFVDDAEELGAEVKTYLDDNATIMELLSGRVDGAITDRLVAVEAMNSINGGENLQFAGEILRLEEMAVAINKEDTHLLDKVNEILQEMHDDGTLSEISERWFDGQDITVK